MTTFNGGSLGSCIDEERCELRYVMRIAQLSESSNLWTHIALGQSMLQHAWSSVVSKPHITFHFKHSYEYFECYVRVETTLDESQFANLFCANRLFKAKLCVFFRQRCTLSKALKVQHLSHVVNTSCGQRWCACFRLLYKSLYWVKRITHKIPLFMEESNFFPDRPRLRQDYPLNLSI